MKDPKKKIEFDAVAQLELSRVKSKMCASFAVKKAKAGGGIAASAPVLAKWISESYGDGGELGTRRAYLAASCSTKAMAMIGEGVFDLVKTHSGPTLAPSEKRALFEELRLLVDDRLDVVLSAAFSIGEIHLNDANVPELVREMESDEPIGSSLALFGPIAMVAAKPKVRAKPRAK